MSWIDEEFGAERQRDDANEQDRDRELHRAKLLDAKGEELWEALKTECSAKVDEYVAKCGDKPQCQVVFENVAVHQFVVRRTQVRAPHAEVELQLKGYKIKIKHSTPPAVGSAFEREVTVSFLILDCDGLEVVLKSGGSPITVAKAAKDVLRPVLFAQGNL
jgi:hypothetical protein